MSTPPLDFMNLEIDCCHCQCLSVSGGSSQDNKPHERIDPMSSATDPMLGYILPPIALAMFVAYVLAYAFFVLWRPLTVNLGLTIMLRRRWIELMIRENQVCVCLVVFPCPLDANPLAAPSGSSDAT